MRGIIDSIRRSFSAKLSIWVVIFAALVFLITQAYTSLEARRSVQMEAVKGANQVLENAVLRLNNILEDVELAADNLEWLVYRHLDSQDTLLEYSRSTIQGNAFLNGCSISMKPYFFAGQEYFSAYSGKVDDVIETRQEGGEDYQYFYLDWYLQPKLLNQPCWTEPYSDWDIDDDPNLQTEMLISYCKPLTDKDGEFIGAISLDLDLRWLSETISSVQPYPNSYCILISRGGVFIVHPDQSKLFYETIFTDRLTDPDPEEYELGKAMTSWEEGMRKLEINGVESYVFFRPLKSTGWSMAIVCPEKDIFGGFRQLRNISLLNLALGLLLMFVVCFLVIRRSLKPLNQLARQAEHIASGHFDNKLPDDGRSDEIGTLSRSFAHMQTSLVSYIKELTQTTAKKERIESELQVARNIQMAMVPRTFPPFPDRKDLDLFAFMNPAKEVGGDLYDFFIVKEKLYFCIGDVSGKGVPASLFMAVVRSLFRVAGQQGLSPSVIAGQINDAIVEENEQLMFVTLFIGALDLATGRLDFCNCGHNPPLMLSRTGEAPQFIDCKANTSVGVQPGFVFEGQVLESVAGKPLLLFTDGLNEAENEAHELFGNEGILKALSETPYQNAQTTVETLRSAVAAHIGSAEQSDDLTMVCLELLLA